MILSIGKILADVVQSNDGDYKINIGGAPFNFDDDDDQEKPLTDYIKLELTALIGANTILIWMS